MNQFKIDSITTEIESHEPAKKLETFADIQDTMLDVLGGKTEEITQVAPANDEDEPTSYHRKIAADIADAQKGLDDVDESELRGLPKEFLRRFEVGYLPNYQHQKFPSSRRTARFIFRLGDSSDPPSINAVLTLSMREFFKKQRGNFGKAAEKCLSEGNKLVFNPKALDAADITAITEGEWDALSIMFATDESVKVCALGGAGLFRDLKKRLASKERPPKIVILFDKDAHKEIKTGQDKAAELLKWLSENGIVATVKFFDDFLSDEQKKLVGDGIDANAILQKCGAQVLKALTEEIIRSAREDFSKSEMRIEQAKNLQAEPKKKNRREKYSPEIEDLINRINTEITDVELEKSGYIHHSERGSARPDGYCCQWCGSGTGEHQTGALKYITDDGEPHFGCGKCGRGGNVITLIAHVDNLPTSGKEFFDTLKYIADKFNVTYDPKIFAPPKKPVTNDAPALDIPADLQEELTAFQEQHGIIDPKILPKLEAAKQFIDGLSALNFKAAFAYEPASRSKVALCKFYLPSIAQKFFDTLKAARKLSAALLKQISRETDALEKAGETVPNVDIDEVTRLSEIAPSKIESEVDKAVTDLRRKQKRFDRKQCAELTAKAAQDAIDAYNANPFWTQGIIRDCPINLLLPGSVYFSTSGVGTQTLTDKDQQISREATKSPIIPTKIFRTPKSHVTKYEVAIKTRRHWRHIIVDGDELADTKKILRLAKDGGTLIKDAKVLTAFFAEIIAANEDRLPEIVCYTRPGWHDGKFIYPTPADGDNYIVKRSGIDYDSIFKARGNKNAWLRKFLEVINGEQGALKRIVIGACLVAPTLGVIKIPNPQFNIWGTSNYAKTPLPKFGLSVFGDPTEGKMFRTWASTAKNMLAMAAGFNSLPLLVDEGETMTKWTQANLSGFIYDFQAGIVNQANKRNGDVRESESFRGVRISTAEHPFHSINDKQGNFKRLIDIHVAEELFDDDYARELHLFCEDNHGHFGRKWTQYIAEHKDELAHDFKQTNEFFAGNGFERDGLHADFKSVDATNARAVIACAVAFYHFCKCLGVNEKYDLPHACVDAAQILAQLPTVKEISDVQRSIDLLASWIVGHPRNFITPQKHTDDTPIDGMDEPAQSYTETVGKKFADGRIAFLPTAFRKICVEIGIPSYEKFLSDLYDADYLDCPNQREKCKVVKIDGKPTRAYVINRDALDLKDNNSDNYDD